MPSGTRGIFGGSFDPVHMGHLTVARAAVDLLQLDRLHLVPANTQPLKQAQAAAPAAHRLAMLRLAVGDGGRIVVDDREIRRGGVSYTVDTVRDFTREFPEDQLSLLVGADAASELDRWRDSDEVAEVARIVVLTRPGVDVPVHGVVDQVLTVPAVAVSATDIRDRVRRNETIAGLVPEAVAAYIASHRLYSVEV
jgi:nicotinate-nucleotide adenylyltransferase